MTHVSKLDTLDKIFGGAGKVKIMRLFLFNPEEHFEIKDISRRAKVTLEKARSIANSLERIGMIKKRTFRKETKTKTMGLVKRKVKGWILDQKFGYLVPLKNILVKIRPCRAKDIKEKFSSLGKIKLIIISGLFIEEWESRLDIIIVGDNLRKIPIENALHNLEAEIGKELKYAVFTTPEFRYRLSVFDKLVRDVLDFPHEVVVDKLDPPISNYK